MRIYCIITDDIVERKYGILYLQRSIIVDVYIGTTKVLLLPILFVMYHKPYTYTASVFTFL